MAWMICQPNRFPVGWRIRPHAHPQTHELVLVTSGRLQTTMAGRTHLAGPGTAMLHPAGLEHGEQASGGRGLETLYLGWSAHAADGVRDLPLVIADGTGHVHSGLLWLADLVGNGATQDLSAAHGLLTALLHEMARSASRRDHDLVRQIGDFVQTRLSQPLTLDDLAAVTGLSRHHFARRFHAAAGTSPMRYLRSVRIARARHLLTTTEMTVDAVAAEVGMPDRFHFSRVFRQVAGLAPGRLRQDVQRSVGSRPR